MEDPKFWLLVCFVVFIILIIKPFRKSMIGGLDNKIEAIKENINISLESFKTAERRLNDALSKTKDLEAKIKDLLENAKVQSKMLSETITEKTNSTINSKEKNSIQRIRQIELSAVQEIKIQASIKLNEILIEYFQKMPLEHKKNILTKKINSMNSFQ